MRVQIPDCVPAYIRIFFEKYITQTIESTSDKSYIALGLVDNLMAFQFIVLSDEAVILSRDSHYKRITTYYGNIDQNGEVPDCSQEFDNFCVKNGFSFFLEA